MEINDSFVRELVSILNEIAADNGSNIRFKSRQGGNWPSNTDSTESDIFYYLLYEDIEDKEEHIFLRVFGVTSGEVTPENLLDNFKYLLIKAIILLKDNLTDTKQVRSMRTLLSKPSVEKKIFNKFEKYLDEYED